MDERPAKLPFAATRVVKASRLLSAGQKLVWLEDWTLDQGPEGAWISATNLATRLGMSKDNVERHRRRLCELGLYHVVRRRGARSDGWSAMFPPLCLPAARPGVKGIMTSAAQLDQILEARPPSGGTDGALVAPSTAPRLAASDVPRAPEARWEGGRGEGSNLSSSGRETSLQPLSPYEDGEVAHATNSEVGGVRFSPSSRGWKLDSSPERIVGASPDAGSGEEPSAAAVEQAGWEELRRRCAAVAQRIAQEKESTGA